MFLPIAPLPPSSPPPSLSPPLLELAIVAGPREVLLLVSSRRARARVFETRSCSCLRDARVLVSSRRACARVFPAPPVATLPGGGEVRAQRAAGSQPREGSARGGAREAGGGRRDGGRGGTEQRRGGRYFCARGERGWRRERGDGRHCFSVHAGRFAAAELPGCGGGGRGFPRRGRIRVGGRGSGQADAKPWYGAQPRARVGARAVGG